MASSSQSQALITGASSGIGRATALAFAQSGLNLVLLGRSQAKLDQVATAAQEHGVSVQTLTLDLAQVSSLPSRLTEMLAGVGPIDILVNNAGMGYTGALATVSLADWQHVLDLNVTSVFLCSQAVLPQMRSRQRGTIINVASVAAYQVFPDWGPYCVSKAALVTLSKALATEEQANGIRVSVVSPGAVNTPLWDTDTVQADFARDQMLTPEMVADTILQIVSVPTAAIIEELKLMPSTGTL
ncbi:MAG: SDR family oxidoreductase [Cyanobacteria bacterium P01_H01_bin.121]